MHAPGDVAMRAGLLASYVVALSVALMSGGVTARAEGNSVFRSVTVSASSFLPSSGDSVTVSVSVSDPGNLTVAVLDRDGFVVRNLVSAKTVTAGSQSFRWDGRDNGGTIVADEAYSFHMIWTDGQRRSEYLPAARPAPMQSVPVRYYSRRAGTVVYDLPAAARVHLQAGVARKNSRSGEMEGPVLKTVVNREPRGAGRIAEQWNGMDESDMFVVPDLPNFVLAVAYTALPESSVIAVGNRQRNFLDSVAARQGTSVLPAGGHGAHHQGLTALDDVSPPLRLEPVNGRWSESDGAWLVSGRTLKLRLSLTGPAAQAFAKQPGQIYRFADGRLLARNRATPSTSVVEIPTRTLTGKSHIISINWRSDHGGVAASSVRIRVLAERAR